ncbi:GEVED domain-containing protein [Ulvibacter antarcticus]|uniref:Putative secreted protein (Por secretion system target) n=1 Tax=Ulvibacter antarcticus TaxID=442714 RepID=A0A3L9Z0J5_9FLAO|nr:GEVED domain-containing protein [Ulvibacter antarcticus]RMA64899.1 putative secreted protein (Por secretion system target) [Ulvibacter antarcticus]
MKKITLLTLLFVCAIGFSQHKVSELGTDIRASQRTQQTSQVQDRPAVNQSNSENFATQMIGNYGDNNPLYFKTQSASVNVTPSRTEAMGVSTLGQNAPYYVSQPMTEVTYKSITSGNEVASSMGVNNPYFAGQGQNNKYVNMYLNGFAEIPTNVEAEIVANEAYQISPANQVVNRPVSNNTGARILADIIPTAGATETFTPALGDHFFDPGGPGGSSTGGTAGNYPNCGCVTLTTLDGVSEVEFQFFSVFANFDWLKIYDSADTSGPILFNNAAGGANEGDITLADMIASHGSGIFTGTSGSLTFEFNATAVVDYGGWDAEITALSAPVVFPAPYCGPLVFTSAVEPMTLVDVAGISNVTDATVGGTPAHEDFTLIVGAMEEGMSYPIALEGNTDGNFTNRFAVFIDWNQNDVLDDAGEVYEITQTIINSNGTDGQQATGSIVVPAGVTAGDTRMRVKKIFGTTNYLDPCLGTGFGQAEDYTITVTTGGGGGGTSGPCATTGPGNAFENGKSFTNNLGRIVAHDVTVDADGDFMLEMVNLNAFIGATGSGVNAAFVDFYVYEDAAGAPGTILTSELAMIPASQTVVGGNFGFDTWDVELDVTDINLPGQAGVPTTYWIGVSLEPTDGSNTFWENSTAGLVGLGEAYDDGLGGGYVLDNTLEGVYTIAGTCTTAGGGTSAPCSTDGLSNAFENGKSFTNNLGRIVAHDVTVDADGDFMLEMVNLNAFIGATGSGVNAAFVDFYVYEDAAGAPGTILTSELAMIPASQTVVGGNFGFDTWDVELDVTDINLPGQAGVPTTYWIGVSLEPTDGSNTFWENSTAGLVGLGEAYDDGLGGGYVLDNTLEGVYTIAGTCTTAGGGTSAPCSTDGLSNAFENGKSFTNNLGRIVAHDVTVAADGDFMLEMVNLNAFIGATASGVNAAFVDFYVYADAAGAPGAILTSELGMVPTAQTVIGGNFGFDLWDVELDVTDINLAGQAGSTTTYWIGVSLEPTDGSNTFWENSTAGLVGLGEAYDDGLGGGFIIDNTLEGVYSFAGTCTGGGGGTGGPCSTEGLSNAFENGKSFTKNLARIVAHDITVAADEEFNLETINLNAFIGATGSGVNAADVDIIIYENSGGLPGAVVTSFAAYVPDSQTVIGNNFGFDVWDVELDIPDVLLQGQAGVPTTYWVGISLEPTDGSNTFWENSTAGLVGLGEAYDDGLSGVFVIDNTLEGVYTFAGTCSPLIVVPDPTYDTCDGARSIMCGEIVAGSTIGATGDSAVAPTCDTTVTAAGVWYKYEDTTGLVTDITITMCNGTTDYDSKLSVYTGDCNAPPLTCVVGNDDTCGLQSEVSFQSDGNTTFYILVHGFGTATGNFELEMLCTPIPPPNDMIANSIDVDENGPLPYTDPAVAMPAATTEAGTPADCDNAGVKGVWYNFVPEGDGDATATITSPAGFSSVTFYTAPNENAVETDLTLVPYFSNQCVPGNTATILTTAGQAYYVYVANHGGITDIVIDGTNLGTPNNTIEGFSYYPNPTEGTLNLTSVDNIESAAIYNMLGQKVIDQNIDATTSVLDLSSLATGTYIMKVSANGQVGTYKILKK